MHWQGLMGLSAQLTLRKAPGPVDPKEELQLRLPVQVHLMVPAREILEHLQALM